MIEGLQIKYILGALVLVFGVGGYLEEGYTAACEAGGGTYGPAAIGQRGYPGWACVGNEVEIKPLPTE